MKNICIFLFSATGLTKYVIDKIKCEFETQQVNADIFYIEKTQIENVQFNNYDTVGIAYPIHSFNAPKIVIDFVKKLPSLKNINAFVLSTGGGSSSLNFSSSELLIKILKKKGFNVFYDRQFTMPSNFASKDDEAEVTNKINQIKEQIPVSVNEIINNIPTKPKSGFFSSFIAFVGRLEWFGLLIGGRIFYADKECNSCGICADNCPNHNIAKGNEHIYFKKHCGLCMRCVYLCPHNCIKAKRLYKFICFDKWYENEELSVTRVIK